MAANLATIYVLCVTTFVTCAPDPGRIPKVYNALITSNQNLEPSKAYPVYQPVYQDPFGFPYQPVFYGNNFPSIYPPAPIPPKIDPATSKPDSSNESEPPPPIPSSTENPPDSNNEESDPIENNEKPKTNKTPDLTPPSTQSPIPLNEFGLPPVVLPLGRYDPSYNGFTQIPTYYNYPGFRFYDPYDPYGLNTYNLPPFYRNFQPFLPPGVSVKPKEDVPPASSEVPVSSDVSSPSPPEPGDLNVLNYSSKDPAIPNVPPPPLPQGGLKTNEDDE